MNLLPDDLFLVPAHCIKKTVQFLRPLKVNKSLADASIQAPCELMTGIHRNDILHIIVVQHHQQFSAQGAVVDVTGAEEERPQELQHHVVQSDVFTNHPCKLLNDVLLSTTLWAAQEEYRRLRLKAKQRRLFEVDVAG